MAAFKDSSVLGSWLAASCQEETWHPLGERRENARKTQSTQTLQKNIAVAEAAGQGSAEVLAAGGEEQCHSKGFSAAPPDISGTNDAPVEILRQRVQNWPQIRNNLPLFDASDHSHEF